MRVLFFLFVGLAVVAVSGCEHYAQPGKVDCSKIVDKHENDVCLYNKSVFDLNSMTCRDIMDTELRGKCIDEIAVRLLDFYPCRQHDKMAKKDACESLVGDARRATRHT